VAAAKELAFRPKAVFRNVSVRGGYLDINPMNSQHINNTLTRRLIMSDRKERLEEMVSSLKQIRDELKVQIHLGKAEAKDEWEKLEEKWQELKAHKETVAEAVEESAKDVGSALELVGGELKAGYERIKKLL
jgi:hypothetical protein